MILKNPDKFPNIYCPETEADCLFYCLDHTDLNLKYDFHKLKQELKLEGIVPVKKVSRILPYINISIQVIIHNVKQDGTFPIYNRDCTKIPNEPQGNRKQVHLGHIRNHYFLIKGEQGI